MGHAVLDGSALLAYILAEAGADEVNRYIGVATMSAVNLSEIVARLADKGAPEDLIRGQVQKLGLSICTFDEDIAYAAGMLRERTKELGLSLGDRACIATAAMLNLPAVTADRQWAELDLGITVKLIR